MAKNKKARPSRGNDKTKTLNRSMGPDGRAVTTIGMYTMSFMRWAKRQGITLQNVVCKRGRKE